MTKEEAIETIKDICLTTEQLTRVENALECLLSQLPLPSDLDEAAEKYTNDSLNNLGAILRVNVSNAFKAGAEWMAGRFEKVKGEPIGWYQTSEGKEYCHGIDTDKCLEVQDFYIRKK